MLTTLSISYICILLSTLIPISVSFSYENPVFSPRINSPLTPSVTFDPDSQDYILMLSHSSFHDYAIRLFHSKCPIDWIPSGWAVSRSPGAWNMDSSLDGVRMLRTKYKGASVMVLVFTAMLKGQHCIGYGFTREGDLNSFIVQEIPLHCSDQRSNLFPSLYQDTPGDYLYLIWSEQNATGSHIFSCALIFRGRLQLKPNTKSLLLASNAGLSTPYLFHYNSYYYLLYTSEVGSVSSIQIARSRLKSGPFDVQSVPIIRSNPSVNTASWRSPSYPSLMRTSNGVFIMLYQGTRFNPSINWNQSFLLLDQLEYASDSQWFRMVAVCGMDPDHPYPSSCRHDIP